MTFKNETYSCGKLSKELVTVVFGANNIGIERLRFLVIWKYRNLHCLTNIKSLPGQYEHQVNRKA